MFISAMRACPSLLLIGIPALVIYTSYAKERLQCVMRDLHKSSHGGYMYFQLHWSTHTSPRVEWKIWRTVLKVVLSRKETLSPYYKLWRRTSRSSDLVFTSCLLASRPFQWVRIRMDYNTVADCKAGRNVFGLILLIRSARHSITVLLVL